MRSIFLSGSSGLIGSEAARHWHSHGFKIIGIDNDMRAEFFGPEASTAPTRARLEEELPNYSHQSIDIRDRVEIENLFRAHGNEIAAVGHMWKKTGLATISGGLAEWQRSSAITRLGNFSMAFTKSSQRFTNP
jgi:nucleoside-diphosphate-sugar epimerase